MAYSHLLTAPHVVPDIFDFLEAQTVTDLVIAATKPRGRASGTLSPHQPACVTIRIDADVRFVQ